MSSPDEPARRTADTVVHAAVGLLVERGLAGFTTTEVARRSGVAHGTVFRYFPTKLNLLVATFDAAVRTSMEDHAAVLGERLEADPPDTDRDVVELVVDVMWDAYTDDRVVAAYEVRAACRTDEHLAAAMLPLLRTSDADGGDLLALLIPESFRVPGSDLRSVTRLVTNALQGRAFTRTSMPDPIADEILRSALVEVILDRIRTPGTQLQSTRPGASGA